MNVLILKNITTEGPGTIEQFFAETGTPYRIADLGREQFPDAAGYDSLVLLGGPMSVNDEKEYPYITEEIRLAERFMKDRKPVFGICLGSQIMARALGSRVYPGPSKELGWADIELTQAGLSDPRMKTLAKTPHTGEVNARFPVFHWHGETFDLPAGAELLAGTALYPHQAFRYGDCAYAFQFHIEVTRAMIYEWMLDEDIDHDAVRRDTGMFHGTCSERARNFYRTLFVSDRTTVRTSC